MSHLNTEKEPRPANYTKDQEIGLLNTSFRLQLLLQTLVNGTLSIEDYNKHQTDQWLWVYIALSDAIKNETLKTIITHTTQEFTVESSSGHAYRIYVQQGLVSVSTNYDRSQQLLVTYSYKPNPKNP